LRSNKRVALTGQMRRSRRPSSSRPWAGGASTDGWQGRGRRARGGFPSRGPSAPGWPRRGLASPAPPAGWSCRAEETVAPQASTRHRCPVRVVAPAVDGPRRRRGIGRFPWPRRSAAPVRCFKALLALGAKGVTMLRSAEGLSAAWRSTHSPRRPVSWSSPGEKVARDGVVLDGASAVDMSLLTARLQGRRASARRTRAAQPRRREPGDGLLQRLGGRQRAVPAQVQGSVKRRYDDTDGVSVLVPR
jgi:hypothetical protein